MSFQYRHKRGPKALIPFGISVRAWIGLSLICMVPASAQARLFGRSVQSDIEQGKEAAKQVETQIGLYSLPDAQLWLTALGARLVEVVDDPRWQFSFQIVDQAEPNAFAIPGGGIYVTRGLLTLVEREDELAGVLGHEIAHVTRRHSAHQQRRGILPGLLTVPGNLVGVVVGEHLGALINAPIEVIEGIGMGRYSRGQESEADRIGTRTTAEAGYDPAALADILERLENDVTARSGEERPPSLFDSHPMTETRMRNIHYMVDRLTVADRPPLAADSATLLEKFDGMWWGKNPEKGVFEGNRFVHPVIGFTITMPGGWKHANTPAAAIASHPEKEALLVLGMEAPGTDPMVVGQAFVEKMRSEAGSEPESVRSTPVNGHPTFVATYLEESGRTPTHVYFAWTQFEGLTFSLIGLAPPEHEATLRTAARSLRPMTMAERSSVVGKRIRIISAMDGERLSALSLRSGNAWTPAYTGLVNGLEESAVLAEGWPVKIVRIEPVFRIHVEQEVGPSPGS